MASLAGSGALPMATATRRIFRPGKDQGKVWDDALLNDYLENPKHLAPHGKMSFAGIKNDGHFWDVIAYLKQFDAQGNKK